MKPIPVTVSPKKYYALVLETLKPIYPFSGLTGNDTKVLALILFYTNHHLDKGYEDMNRLVFDYDSRLVMREELNMKLAGYNNCITSLRKLGILEGKKIKPQFILSPDKDNVISYQFNII